MMRAVIVVNGEGASTTLIQNCCQTADYIIAVDGGLNHLDGVGITPHIIVGDMDSYEQSLSDLPSAVEVHKLNPKKDMSDLAYAFDIAIQKGVTEIVLLSAWGNRFDHTLTNLNVLRGVTKRGIGIVLQDDYQRLWLAKDKQVLDKMYGKTFSLVPLSDLAGVTITGAKYPLKDVSLPVTSSLCLSNEATAEQVEICIGKGMAYIIVIDRLP